MAHDTFIIDCPRCRAKVAAICTGTAARSGQYHDSDDPFAEKLLVGKCPVCETLLAGRTEQIAFENFGSYYDEWSDVVRVFPSPGKAFTSIRIPKSLNESLCEGDKSLQAGAYTAACAMFGRALEALCRDVLQNASTSSSGTATTPPQKLMLAEGIKRLKDGNHIDQRLYDWSQELHAFRNIAAHPDDAVISRRDAEDIQTFVYAIVEYIYDLADRYSEFKERIAKQSK